MQYIYIVLFLPLAPPLLSSPPRPPELLSATSIKKKKKIKINNTKGSKLKRKLKQLKLVHATAAAH